MVEAFRTFTAEMLPKLDFLMEAPSLSEWVIRKNALRADLLRWRELFDEFPRPPPEGVLESAEQYVSKLTDVMTKMANYKDSSPAAGGRKRLTRLTRRRRLNK